MSKVYAIDWDTLINRTAPNLTAKRSIGELLSGAGRTTGIIEFISASAGIILLMYLIYGGFQLLTSGGDPNKIQAGKSVITNALLGFVIIFIAYFIVQAVGLFLGLEGITRTFGG